MLEPTEVFNHFKYENWDKTSTIQSLFHIIENSNNEKHRLLCLHYLNKIRANDLKTFQILENLLISDSNKNIRNYAIRCLSCNFIDKAFSLFRWAIRNENDYDCYVSLIHSLLKLKEVRVKSILIEEIEKLKKRRSLDEKGNYSNKKFIDSLKYIIGNYSICSPENLAEIIVDYRSISHLIKKYCMVFCEWERGRVVKLDLSRLVSNWSVWSAWIYKFCLGINHLSEVSEILNFNKLRYLNLSNNKIDSIKTLNKLKNLTHLYLAFNRLKSPENIEYLKDLKELKYLDLRGNPLSEYIDQKEFPEVRIIKHNSLWD